MQLKCPIPQEASVPNSHREVKVKMDTLLPGPLKLFATKPQNAEEQNTFLDKGTQEVSKFTPQLFLFP